MLLGSKDNQHDTDDGGTQPPSRSERQEAARQRQEAARRLAEGCTGADLLAMDIPASEWIVPGLISSGLALLGGRPKKKKSWLALDLAVAGASGGLLMGALPVTAGECLYLSLEDTAARLKERLKAVGADAGVVQRIQFRSEWPRMDKAGGDQLKAWLRSHPDTRLVVVDTLQHIKARPAGAAANAYEADYEAMGHFKKIADEFGICVLLVHHTRKATAEDVFDELMGTTAMTGAPDTLLVIARGGGRSMGTLHARGRDLKEDREIILKWQSEKCRWQYVREVVSREDRSRRERDKILAALQEAAEPLMPCQVAARLDKERGAVKKLMGDMAEEGEIEALGKGRYALSDETVTGNLTFAGQAQEGASETPSKTVTDAAEEKLPVTVLCLAKGHTEPSSVPGEAEGSKVGLPVTDPPKTVTGNFSSAASVTGAGHHSGSGFTPIGTILPRFAPPDEPAAEPDWHTLPAEELLTTAELRGVSFVLFDQADQQRFRVENGTRLPGGLQEVIRQRYGELLGLLTQRLALREAA
jgi:hypothetical protein